MGEGVAGEDGGKRGGGTGEGRRGEEGGEVEHAIRRKLGLRTGDERRAGGAVGPVERVAVEVDDVAHGRLRGSEQAPRSGGRDGRIDVTCQDGFRPKWGRLQLPIEGR